VPHIMRSLVHQSPRKTARSPISTLRLLSLSMKKRNKHRLSEALERASNRNTARTGNKIALCKLLPEDTTAFKIIGRMCPKDGAQQCRDTLKLMDSTYGFNMDAGLAEGCTFQTRVLTQACRSE
jgi:hypothetical protein